MGLFIQSRIASLVASFKVLLPLVAGITLAPSIFILATFGLSVLLLPNQGGLGLKKLAAINLQQFEGFSPAVPGAVIQATPESRLAELTARETSLRARKAALDPNDLATAQALSDEILKYNADLKAVTDVQPPSQSGGASVVSYNSVPK